MLMTHDQMDKKMDEHFSYEATDDVEGVLSTLTPDATHDIVGWPDGPSHGREGARSFYETMFADLSDSTVTSKKRLYGENFLVDESVWKGKAPGQPFGLKGNGRPLTFRILHIIEFAKSGQMQSEQVWLDMAAINQQLSQE